MNSQEAADGLAPLPRYRFPVSLTSLVGREYDIQTVSMLLRRSDVRLLTLTGVGGIGKTRLAVRVATELQLDFPDGVCFVSLATISDPEFVLPAIAQMLGLKEGTGQAIKEQLYTYLRTQHMLLVLDNYEQVVTTAPLLADLVGHCPQLKILVTSRTVLHIDGEQEYSVVPLAVPNLGSVNASKSVTQYASVALFVERAQACKPEFQVTEDNVSTIAEICVRVDGLPLAIELAATRVKVLSVKQIAARLHNAHRLLLGDNRTALPRQRTLQATMDWSYNLLSEQEQTLFCRLCVFVGSCTLEAIEAICAGGGIEEGQILQVLSHLVDHSLVLMQEQDDVVRYRMLEVIRQFGWEKLKASGEAANLSRCHRNWYLGLAERAEQELVGKHQGEWLDYLEAEHDNLRYALGWSLEQKEGEEAARIGVSLWPFWIIRNHMGEGGKFLALSVAQLHGFTALRAKLLRISGVIMGRNGEHARAMQLLEESLDIWRTVSDKQGTASTLLVLGVGALTIGDYERATVYYEQSLPFLREMKDKHEIALALNGLGLTLLYQGKHERASELFEESLALCREIGDIRSIAAILANQGMISLEQGDYIQAIELCQESLALRRKLGDKGGSAHVLIILGRVAFFLNKFQKAFTCYRESLALRLESGEKEGIAAALEGIVAICSVQGDTSSAARLLGAAAALREASGVALSPIDRSFSERSIVSVKARLGEQAFDNAWAEGGAFTLKQALELQEQLNSMMQSPARSTTHALAGYPDELTAREVEVLGLVAQGLSDSAVAERLVLSPRTVQGHLRSIYSKLHVNSRSGATRYAIEHQLV